METISLSILSLALTFTIPSKTNNYFKRKSDCVVIESFDGNLYGNILDTIYSLERIDKNERYSKNFDVEQTSTSKKKKYIPPLNHPWRIDNIHRYFGSQKHRQNGANV